LQTPKNHTPKNSCTPEYRGETPLPNIGLVDSGSFFVEEQLKRLKGAVRPLDIYELPGLDLDRFSGLLIPGSVDQEWLHLHRVLIEAFGSTSNGRRLVQPWLNAVRSKLKSRGV
jgi:hypothetical protein